MHVRFQLGTHPSSRQTAAYSAVTELMSHSKKLKPPAAPTSAFVKARNLASSFDPRNGLGVYIEKPETNPEGRVVEYDDDFVVINDKYPKAR